MSKWHYFIEAFLKIFFTSNQESFWLPNFSWQLALFLHVSDQSILRESKSITHRTIKRKVLWLWLIRRQSTRGSHSSREQQQWKGQRGENPTSYSLGSGAEPPKREEMMGCLELGIPKETPRGQYALATGRLENKNMRIFLVEREK